MRASMQTLSIPSRKTIDGTLVPGANIVDLVNDAMRDRRRSAPPGDLQFTVALRQSTVAREFTGNKRVWNEVATVSSASDHSENGAFATPCRVPIVRVQSTVTKQNQRNPKKEERSQLRKKSLATTLCNTVMAGNEQDIRARLINSQEEEQEKNSVLDALVDLLPFEMHVPHYKFCGPGTKLAERIERGDIGINPLDEACRQHDLAYTDLNSDRCQADRVLAQYVFSRMLAEETPSDERTVVMMTACCMVSKITFEKFLSRIKNVMRKRDKKNKKSKRDQIKKDKKKEQKPKNKKNKKKIGEIIYNNE